MKEVGYRVVENPSVLFADQPVAGLIDAHVIHAVGEVLVEKAHSIRAEDLQATHVGYVKYSRLAPDDLVLFYDADVQDRHFPARELDHSRAQFSMHGIEGGLSHALAPLHASDTGNSAFPLGTYDPQLEGLAVLHPRLFATAHRGGFPRNLTF